MIKLKIITSILLMITWLVIYFFFNKLKGDELYGLYVLGFCVCMLMFISFDDLRVNRKYKYRYRKNH